MEYKKNREQEKREKRGGIAKRFECNVRLWARWMLATVGGKSDKINGKVRMEKQTVQQNRNERKKKRKKKRKKERKEI